MDMQSTSLPDFDRPPVIETALGVQFAPIGNFTTGFYGWFWKAYLDATWTKTQDAPRMPAQFEKFGENDQWQTGPPFMIQESPHAGRIYFINETDDRIIQLQSDRLVYNWRKRQKEYPSFKETYPEFRGHLQLFERFVRESGLAAPFYNQWELTYVNAVPKGELWESPADWGTIFPGLFVGIDTQDLGVIRRQAMCNLKFEIVPKMGHLYIATQHVKIEDNREALLVNLTARGPLVTDDEGSGLATGIFRGHEAIVRTFHQIASPKARAHWGGQ
jgi:uncharacterized protein (TIGR04255 family)